MARKTGRRTRAVEALAQLFKTRGFAGASLTECARATGLGRASLYHHFPGGKADMGRAALAHEGQRFARLVLEPLGLAAPGDARLAAMFDGLAQYYAQSPDACLMNSMTLAAGEDDFAAVIRDAVGVWRARMADCLGGGAEGLARADDVIAGVQGAVVLARIAGEPGRFAAALARLRARTIAGAGVEN